MAFSCTFHGEPIPCKTCTRQEITRLEAENKQRRKDGIQEHDLTELKKIIGC